MNRINYQLMTPAVNGKYYPEYDRLIAGATCEEEAEYLRKVKERNFPFAFNMVYVMRMACGHFEIFQSPQNEHYSLEYVLKCAAENAAVFRQ